MKPKHIVYTRLGEEKEIAEKIAEKMGISLSDFIRLSLRAKLAEMSFLDSETKKVFNKVR